MKKRQFSFSNLMQSKITWAVIAELLILLVCFIIRPDFFSIKYQPATGMLYGSLIDIVNRSAEITIIAMGMTLVLALGGTDLSVGSLVALSGALALKFLRWDVLIYNTPGDYTVKPFILVILVPLAVCTLMGLFNGFMISRIGMQPIIATLILMVCGRGIAQIVTNGKQFTTLYSPFRVIGQGSLFFLPMPIIITIVVVAAVSLFVRRTAFGTMVESVGINPSASRLSKTEDNLSKADWPSLASMFLTNLAASLLAFITSAFLVKVTKRSASLTTSRATASVTLTDS